ncbi:hypothetical protein ACFL95_005249 [Klebsiella oxytoca]
MTDITKLAQSLKSAAKKAIAEEGSTWWNEEQLASDYGLALHRTDAKFIALASHENVLALVEALEKAQQRIDDLENDEVRQSLANAEHQLYMAELAKAYQQLAAENVALKSFGDKLNDMHNELNGEGTGIQGRAEVACQQVALEAAMEEFDAIETPATDRIMAESEARGVEKAIAHLEKKFSNIGVQIMNLQWLADSLREGDGK